MEERVKVQKRTEVLLKTKSRRITSRAGGLASLGVGLLLLVGGATLFLLGNAGGILLLVGAFLVLGAVSGLFQGTPYRSRVLNRARRNEDARKRRREMVDN
jgi:hypothetical protein